MHSAQRTQPALKGIKANVPSPSEPLPGWRSWRLPLLAVKGKVPSVYKDPVQVILSHAALCTSNYPSTPMAILQPVIDGHVDSSVLRTLSEQEPSWMERPWIM